MLGAALWSFLLRLAGQWCYREQSRDETAEDESGAEKEKWDPGYGKAAPIKGVSLRHEGADAGYDGADGQREQRKAG
jgi:hypothetical protein